MELKKDEKGGYTPKGTYLDAGLSAADKAAVGDLSRQWSEAQARGDQAAMDAAHKAAEAIRSGYGYSGGGDGSEYIALPKEEQKVSTPGDWIGGGSGGVSGSGAVGSWSGGKFTYESAPAYTNKYKGKIDELTEQILGRAAFEYDPEKDPTYQQYKQSYTRNGERAMQDTLGQVAARTGGLASSYAGAAAQQTYDGYMSALADKIPELRQLAYEMYQDEGATQRANLEMLQALEQGDYNKYLTLLGQYNTDRSMDYGIFRDQVGYSQWKQTFDRGVYESDRDYAYQVGQDEVADKRYEQEYKDSRDDVEWQRLNYTSEQEYERALSKAQTLAAAGDFSGYQDMGYSEAEVSNLKKAYDKAQAAISSSGSGGGGGKKSGSQDTGILAAMYAMGNDAAAYEYLVGLDLSAGKTDTIWELYQSGGQTQSRNYSTVKATAAGYKNLQDAKAYLERMVDGGYITPDEAASIYQVDLGGTAQVEQSAPTTYKEFSALTGNPMIMTESEFSRRKSAGSQSVAQYKNYQDYLAKKYEEYKK